MVMQIRPRTVLEIGTAKGGSLILFGRLLQPDLIVSVDLPHGRFGGGYPAWMGAVFRKLSKTRLCLIRGDSHSEFIMSRVKRIVKKVDFLFIDGDHTYEGVKTDFSNYLPLVRRGGIIAFHDICVHPSKTGCEVSRFWTEIKGQFNFREIMQDREQGWGGIGLLYA
jgi:predicted O-methyltransferase YrrM